MKKSFFIAIAIIGFTGTSKANSLLTLKMNCTEIRNASVHAATQSGATPEEAYVIGAVAYNTCRIKNAE